MVGTVIMCNVNGVLALRDCYMVIFNANVLLQLLPNKKFFIHYKVHENAPEAVSESLKTKVSWGSMPSDPLFCCYIFSMYDCYVVRIVVYCTATC